MMAIYRGKYILDGLDEIPENMMNDLDLAFDVCMALRNAGGCECCGKCCRQPFITVMDEEVERISDYLGMNAYDFVTQYLYREDDRWLFRKEGACAFLDADNRCGIWPGRPEICRDFPYLVSKLMSAVYLAIVYDEYELDLEYMEDDWPCTSGIKTNAGALISEARKKRSMA